MGYSFDFALSFSSECRTLARQLSELLVRRGARVFYDEYFLVNLLGKRIDDELAGKFGEETQFFVPFVSSEYGKRPWPQYEWSVASSEAQRRNHEFILPLRVDDTRLFGLPDTTCYLDLRKMDMVDVADVLIGKLEASIGTSEGELQVREWVATFGVLLERLDDEDFLRDAPSNLPALYDWLTEDLMDRLAQAPILGVRILEDLRDGEQLSVRFGFEWDFLKEALDFGNMGNWELLELAPYKDVYE